MRQVRIILFGIWTVAAFSWAFFTIPTITEVADIHTGKTIQFTASRDLQIEAHSVQLNANSCNFFALQSDSGETIYGTRTKAPWGSVCGTSQYVFPPQEESEDSRYKEIPGGYWTFHEGMADLEIKADTEVTVKEIDTHPELGKVLTAVAIFVVWLFVIIVFNAILPKPKPVEDNT